MPNLITFLGSDTYVTSSPNYERMVAAYRGVFEGKLVFKKTHTISGFFDPELLKLGSVADWSEEEVKQKIADAVIDTMIDALQKEDFGKLEEYSQGVAALIVFLGDTKYFIESQKYEEMMRSYNQGDLILRWRSQGN